MAQRGDIKRFGKAINFKLAEEDLANCQKIQATFGFVSRCEAIRFALRFASRATASLD